VWEAGWNICKIINDGLVMIKYHKIKVIYKKIRVKYRKLKIGGIKMADEVVPELNIIVDGQKLQAMKKQFLQELDGYTAKIQKKFNLPTGASVDVDLNNGVVTVKIPLV